MLTNVLAVPSHRLNKQKSKRIELIKRMKVKTSAHHLGKNDSKHTHTERNGLFMSLCLSHLVQSKRK